LIKKFTIDSRFVLVLSLVGIYVLVNFGLPTMGNRIWSTYLILPVTWLLLFIGTLKLLSPARTPRERVRQDFLILALTGGISQLVAYVFGGVFSSFGESPYTFTLLGISRNLFLVTATLLGMEFSRAWLIRRMGSKHTWSAVVFVGLVFTVIAVPWNALTSLRLETDSIAYLTGTFFPLLAENLLATRLAHAGGPLASLLYRGILQLFWWFSPVIPDLQWTFRGLIGIIVPLLLLVAAGRLESSLVKRPRIRMQPGFLATAGWLMAALAGVCIIWFSVGLFPLKPALIASGSMRPYMEVGDVAVMADFTEDNIQVGDVIQIRRTENENIIHRVIEIQETENGRVFVTKGDANEDPDIYPAAAIAVTGKNVFIIPKVGWLAVLVKSVMGNR
jgi:signal peptidase